MKKLSILMAVLMILMTFPVMFMTSVSAVSEADAAAAASGTPFKVGTDYYATYNEAYAAANVVGAPNTIEILSDVTISDATTRFIGAYPKQDLVIDGNGFTVTDSYGNGAYGWKIDNSLTYTVTVKDVTVETNGFWQAKGKVVCENVTIDSNNTNVYGAVVVQTNTDLTFTGNSVISSNPTPSAKHNSTNPVFAFNDTDKTTLTIGGNTVVNSYNSLFYQVVNGNVVKGDTLDSVVINVKDNATINSLLNSLEETEGNILVLGEMGNIEFNLYGGTINSTANIALYLGNANCKGAVANIYGGTLNGSINWSSAYADFNYCGGNVTLNGAAYTATPEYVIGASVRTEADSTGLRFRSIFSAATIASVEAGKAENIDYKIGTIILPYEYLSYTDGGVLTHESLDAAGLPYLDIEAVKGIDADAEGNLTINAAIVNLREENKAKDFIATAYIQWTDTKGTVWTAYSNPVPTEDVARSAVEVATAALDDVKDAAEGLYTNAVTTYAVDGVLVTGGEIKYSKYSQAEMTNIAKLLPTA